MRRFSLFLAAFLFPIGCDGDLQPPIGRPDDGRARFELLSSWEPSIQRRAHLNLVAYGFVLGNGGGRAGAPSCEILYRDEPLPGWSEGPEIGAEDQGRVEGEALLPHSRSPQRVLEHLEPQCREATGKEPWTGVPKRFFGMEGDVAFFQLRQQGYRVRFGDEVSPEERQNVRGRRSHPEVVITAARRERGARSLTIVDVDCVGREKNIC